MHEEAAGAGHPLRHGLTHRIPLSVRRLPYTTLDAAQALADRRRLRAARPDLAAMVDHLADDAELHTQYRHYVTDVSDWEWAVSWPTARLLLTLCDGLRPRRVLDLGSGFSTYVIASWARRRGAELDLVSVDDSPDWLDKTRAFLAGHDLTATLVDAGELPSLPDAHFDLAFDDIGRSEVRARVIDTVVRVMAPEAVTVLDDMNVRGYRAEVKRKLDAAGWPLFSARAATLDPKGRFAMLTVAPRV
jgi:predicted O-methyltransferase YrrM